MYNGSTSSSAGDSNDFKASAAKGAHSRLQYQLRVATFLPSHSVARMSASPPEETMWERERDREHIHVVIGTQPAQTAIRSTTHG